MIVYTDEFAIIEPWGWICQGIRVVSGLFLCHILELCVLLQQMIFLIPLLIDR